MHGTSSASIYYGAIVNPISLTSYSASPRCLLAVNAAGNIDWVVDDVEPHELQETLAAKGYVDVDVVALKDGEFLIPGFIDTHTHAPQVPNMGTGGQYQLLDWLKYVTFPMESKFSNLEFARKTYESVVRRVIDSGTTTCCYYGTLHLEATKILADVVYKYGQRAFVGKCNMNRESPPDYIEPSSDASITDTLEIISHITSLSKPPTRSSTSSAHEPLVQPVLTPRFAISCTDDLLSALGTLAASNSNLRIQTHISENTSEVAYTRELFPAATSYAGVYDMFGLLRNNTILAHAVHLAEDEVDLIKARDAGISHCPTSNFNLSSGIAPVGAYLDKGIKIGLGTDVSGGFSLSILSAIQHASVAAKVCSIQARTGSSAETGSPTGFANNPLPIPALLYLATAGGAAVCALEKQVGTFAEGKAFDALLVNVRKDASNPGIWGFNHGDAEVAQEDQKELLDSWLERFLFCGDDRNIERVYVQGKLVGGHSFHH
ncbi:hypothetical protein GALMADRAFT_100454 [Galerina marginata CBS 339.88]|uniref:Guanine deaminase n=1 Tax=Galerina marginata (strain CBS 339.88) TaxID=685588 RepID=A0A067SRQ7_GALM3|nr:hypothetical protein GALMADRAFT_100454 [Galerina marginata CBS 339.88]